MLDVRQWIERHPLGMLRVGLLISALSLAFAILAWRVESVRSTDAVFRLEEVRAGIGAVRAEPPGTPTFISELPTTLEAEQIVQRLAATALVQAVALTDSRIQPARTTSESELPRATLAFNLRGPYPGIKATLAETLTRTGNATLHSLSIRRDGKNDLEAQVVLTLWLRPASRVGLVN